MSYGFTAQKISYGMYVFLFSQIMCLSIINQLMKFGCTVQRIRYGRLILNVDKIQKKVVKYTCIQIQT